MSSNQPTRFIRGPAGSSLRSTDVDSLLIETTRNRLALVAGLLAGISVAAFIVIHFVKSTVQNPTAQVGDNSIFLLLQLVSGILVAVLARFKLIPGRYLLLVGLIYQVFVCMCMSIGGTRQSLIGTGAVPLVLWTEVLIVFFPLIVPSKPHLTLVAALLSAGTRPLAMWKVQHFEGATLPENWLVISTVSPLFAVILALVGSRIVYGLGRAAAEARRLGSYHLEERLGAGGMGEVWRAQHQLLARPAAVKLIRADSSGGTQRRSSDAEARFEREAQATAALSSPHTVKLFDFGRADDGTYYYVMELLQGIDLHDLVERYGRLAPDRAVHFARGVCHSLAEAHASGLVHRDIKPANLVVCKYGLDYDVIKVLDFGLVTAAKSKPADPMLTGADHIIGTPAFISPEQATGQSPDHRVDIYAVGCLFYWMLAGRFVFEEQSAMAMAVAHATKTPPTLAELGVDDVPQPLLDLIASCLAKDPAERPQSAGELSTRLRKMEMATPWTEERARAWWSQNDPLGAAD